MTNPCPMCDSVVDNHCLQCDKCNDWIHYKCSKLPAYMIIQLSKSKRAFTCNSCVQSKFSLVFHKLYDEIVGKQDDQTIPSTMCAHSHNSPISPLSPSAPLIPVSPLTPSAPHPPPSPFTPPLRPLAPLLVCGGGVRSILLLPLVARCLETIDVCIWRMFVFMSVVVTVWGSVGMFVV